MSENITKPGSNEANVDELNRARPPIEIGLIVAGRFSLSERRLLQDVEARFKHVLKLRLPEFDWRIVISRRRDIGESGREESTELLRRATEERDSYRWDYAIVIINEVLLSRSSYHREQIAVTRVSAIGIVLTGLALTWSVMFTLAILAAALLFSPELISQWTSSAEESINAITPISYLKMSTFCASVGLLIGALGASFEEQTHFQHLR